MDSAVGIQIGLGPRPKESRTSQETGMLPTGPYAFQPQWREEPFQQHPLELSGLHFLNSHNGDFDYLPGGDNAPFQEITVRLPPPRWRTMEYSPNSPQDFPRTSKGTTSAAELFYLGHLRSAAQSAAGKSGSPVRPSGNVARPQSAPSWVARALGKAIGCILCTFQCILCTLQAAWQLTRIAIVLGSLAFAAGGCALGCSLRWFASSCASGFSGAGFWTVAHFTCSALGASPPSALATLATICALKGYVVGLLAGEIVACRVCRLGAPAVFWVAAGCPNARESLGVNAPRAFARIGCRSLGKGRAALAARAGGCYNKVNRLVLEVASDALGFSSHSKWRRPVAVVALAHVTRPRGDACFAFEDFSSQLSLVALAAIALDVHWSPAICRCASALAMQGMTKQLYCCPLLCLWAFGRPSFPAVGTPVRNSRLWQPRSPGTPARSIAASLEGLSVHSPSGIMDVDGGVPLAELRHQEALGNQGGNVASAQVCGTCHADLNWCSCRRGAESQASARVGAITVGASSSGAADISSARHPDGDNRVGQPASRRRVLSPDRAGDRGPMEEDGASQQPCLHCPVAGCSLAAGGSHRGWASFARMQSHVDSHLSGALAGHIPTSFLESHHRCKCRVCGLCVAASRGVHPRCRASERQAARPASSTNGQAPSGGSGNAPPGAAMEVGRPSMHDVFTARIPTLRYVPHRARSKWSQVLVRCLAAVVLYNNLTVWGDLLMLPKAVLCVPQGSSKDEATAAFTLDRLDRWESGERQSLWADAPKTRAKSGRMVSDEYKRLRAEALTREGLDGKACSALLSKGLIEPSRQSAGKVRALHPAAAVPPRRPLAEAALPPHVAPAVVSKMLRAFPQGTAPGPSGLRVQHLLDACTLANKASVIEQLSNLVALLAQGSAPHEVAPFLAGASLMASPKASGGVRPIAVGEALRRLTAKCLCHEYKEQTKQHLWPVQVGCGSPLGCEVAVHTLRQWGKRNQGNADKVVVKVDFKNAFNCVNRRAFFLEVADIMPGLTRWVEWCYGVSSHLLFGSFEISSEVGVQQGDPLGPLLFSLAIQPLALKLAGLGRDGRPGRKLDLCFFYLDDGVLAGSVEAVSEALRLLSELCPALGLTLELSKSELIVCTDTERGDLRQFFPEQLLIDRETGASRVRCGDFEFLGSPVGSNAHCATHTAGRAESAQDLLDALSEISDPQVGLRLLRRCAGFCKLVYSTRTVPGLVHQDELLKFDDCVRNTFGAITGLRPDEAQWGQASRGFAFGGLGLRSCAKHANAAYTASRSQTLDLCKELDDQYSWEGSVDNTLLAQGLAALNHELPADAQVSPEHPTAYRQQQLSKGLDAKDHADFFGGLQADDKAAINSEMLTGASDFLEAVPSTKAGLSMAPEEFVSELRTRLLMDHFPEDAWCSACDGILDRRGRHAQVCAGCGDRVRKHNGTRNRFGVFVDAACLHPELEKPGLLQPSPEQPDASRRRPADVFVPSWKHGAAAAFDIAITSPHRIDIVQQASLRSGAAAEAYEHFKRSFLDTASDCQRQGISFVPIVGEPSGGWGPSALCVFKSLARTITNSTGRDFESVLREHRHALGVLLRQANARAVFRRDPGTAPRVGDVFASARLALEA